MEIPSLAVESELQLPAYATATATWDPSPICDLYHSSQQCWILNPPSEARDWTCILMVASRVHYCWATTGTSMPTFYTVLSFCPWSSVTRWPFFSFPRAVPTAYHKLGTTEMYSHNWRGWKSEIKMVAGLFPSGGQIHSMHLSWLLVVAGHPFFFF